MATKGSYIIRSDDGKLYRISHEELHAHPLAANDPAAKTHAPILHEAHARMKSGGGVAALACVAAAAETGPKAAFKKD